MSFSLSSRRNAGRSTIVRLVTLSTMISTLSCNDTTSPTRTRMDAKGFGATVVSSASMQGWAFYDDQEGTACSDASICRMVPGPDGQPAGQGSAELAITTSTDGKALILPAFRGVRFDEIADLRYATYRQTADPGNNLAIALQFNVDFDLNDAATGYQGRLVFEPYQGVGGNVQQNAWHDWDAKAGKWWGTRATVWKTDASITNPCVQAAPCTWSQLISAFPNVGVHGTYGAVILKAGSGWPAFRGNVDNLRITVGTTATVYDFELQAPVPALPPDSLPTFYPGGLTSGAPVGADSVERGVVVVLFWPNTPQSERQTAVDMIQGSVIGGLVIDDGDGFYYVRIPDDGTAASVASALNALGIMPQVEMAGPADPNPLSISSRGAIDGNSDYRTWKADPARADGLNWGLERIQAPNAWGCTVGSADARIGVVDQNPDSVNSDALTPLTDLARNTVFLSRVEGNDLVPPNTRLMHGRHVTSIIAARGNDSVGMTGVMWKASLILQDQNASARYPNQPAAREWAYPIMGNSLYVTGEQIKKTAERGADIINLSLNPGYATNPVEPDTASENRAKRPGDMLSSVLRRLRNGSPSRRPLIIISAGNDNAPAYWSGWRTAQINFPDQVILVGASTISNTVWFRDPTFASNTGSWVDLYAPGAGVGATAALGSSPNSVVSLSGTSYAAPMVVGVAGLLKSFDPRLTSGEIKQLILDGARNDGHGTQIESGKYVLNAYESLRRAARRPGAPLCGNHVFVDSLSRLVVERRTGPNPSDFTDELIPAGDFSAQGPGSLSIINFLHDGRYINLFNFDGMGELTLEYRNTDHSWHRIAYDYDSTMARVPSWQGPNYAASHSYHYDPLLGVTWDTLVVIHQRGFWAQDNPNFDVAIQHAGGETLVQTLPGLATGFAYPLRFEEILVAVVPDPYPQEENIVAVNLKTGASRTVWARPPGSRDTFLTQTESGDEFVVAYTSPYPTYERCVTEYRSMVDGRLLRSLNLPAGNGCSGSWPTHGMSANRVHR
jgi:hypothetical protein